MAALANSEPGSSANFACNAPGEGTRTTASLHGDHWVINGAKQWVSSATGWDGRGADVLSVVCRTDPGAPATNSISIIVVTRPERGLETLTDLNSMGHCSHLTPRFRLNAVRAPRDNLIGPPGGGQGIVDASFSGTAALVGIMGVALVRARRWIGWRTAPPSSRCKRRFWRSSTAGIWAFAAAVDMIDNLMRYLSEALPKLRQEESSLADEMHLIDAYLRIHQIRMGRRLSYELSVPEHLGSQRIPTMILLTLVENAVKHGINPAVDGGSIRVSASRERAALVLKVSDSGQGMAATDGHGMGLANIRRRLTMLYGDDAVLSLARAASHGVVATVSIPLAAA